MVVEAAVVVALEDEEVSTCSCSADSVHKMVNNNYYVFATCNCRKSGLRFNKETLQYLGNYDVIAFN